MKEEERYESNIDKDNKAFKCNKNKNNVHILHFLIDLRSY